MLAARLVTPFLGLIACAVVLIDVPGLVHA
ncbi:hypothetical protein FHT17_000925 [Novosphingobium sp. SG916]|nr:hypothetical protein [Novosphingobium sp. SG720]NMN03955.1 hypothetical protein [Novosphingobium sp. SG919]NMN86055.1 hypothetical protein [Novosphingobium sp. SG916]